MPKIKFNRKNNVLRKNQDINLFNCKSIVKNPDTSEALIVYFPTTASRPTDQ